MMMTMIRRLSDNCIFIFLLLFLACDESVQSDAGSARIVIDQSIDGVLIGDDTAAVIQKLGCPDSILPPPRPPQRIFMYWNGAHTGMSLVIRYPQASPPGVSSVSVGSPYSGKTADGIGIGTDAAFVLSRLGSPSDTLASSLIGRVERYAFANTYFDVQYVSDTVVTLAIVSKN
jgi:hypothetical protein